MPLSMLRLTILAGVTSCTIHAGVVYNESINGDLSGSGFTPTLISLAAGSNTILGATGNPGSNATGIDRDYFTVTVPTGLLLSSLTVLPGTVSGGTLGFSFIGIQAGPQVTLPTDTLTATGLLGWHHYNAGDINTNILPLMSFSANGSSGFPGVLSAGQYSFWVQEFDAGSLPYGFDIGVTAATPEPGTWFVAVLGVGALLAKRRVCA